VTAIFAHRGCHGVPAPLENSIEAFVAARDAGADGVEMDVRATADGALAAHHDRHVPGLSQMTNVFAGELPEHVPLLGAALDACSGLRVNVEIKGGPAEAVLVARLLLDRGPGGGAGPAGVIVSSFAPEALAAVQGVAPRLAYGLLVDWRTDPRAALGEASRLGCATLHPFVTQVDGSLLEAARAAGVGIHVWTVNADADLAAMAALGVDAVITDRVDAAVRIIRNGAGRAG
jgi:glycerophosphoryl diester phosphodiesterase